MLINNFKNKRFNSLLVIEKTGKKTKHNNTIWKCRCDCGNTTEVAGGNLKSGHTKSCGCAKAIFNRKTRTIHSMTKTRQWNVWISMRQRCFNKNNKAYKNYGGRGIKVCDRWQDSFKNFWDDMKNGYRDDLTIDRIDNNGNYNKENCRWATMEEQGSNKRNNDIIDFNGETKTLSQWAHSLGWKQPFLRRRIYRDGWSIERALTTPKLK